MRSQLWYVRHGTRSGTPSCLLQPAGKMSEGLPRNLHAQAWTNGLDHVLSSALPDDVLEGVAHFVGF